MVSRSSSIVSKSYNSGADSDSDAMVRVGGASNAHITNIFGIITSYPLVLSSLKYQRGNNFVSSGVDISHVSTSVYRFNNGAIPFTVFKYTTPLTQIALDPMVRIDISRLLWDVSDSTATAICPVSNTVISEYATTASIIIKAITINNSIRVIPDDFIR
jgi:hypothetical protein